MKAMQLSTYGMDCFIRSAPETYKHLVFSFYYDSAIFTCIMPIEELKKYFEDDELTGALTIGKIIKLLDPICYVKGKKLHDLFYHKDMFLLKIMGGTIQYDACELDSDALKCYIELKGYDYMCKINDFLERREENE